MRIKPESEIYQRMLKYYEKAIDAAGGKEKIVAYKAKNNFSDKRVLFDVYWISDKLYRRDHNNIHSIMGYSKDNDYTDNHIYTAIKHIAKRLNLELK